jgi:hypothetical protein
VRGLNGHLRNTVRVEQFKKLCEIVKVSFLVAPPLTIENGYIAGFFCADGSIYLNCSYSANTKKGMSDIKLFNNVKEQVLEPNKTVLLRQAVVNDLEIGDKKLNLKMQKLITGVAPKLEVKIINKFLANIDSRVTAFNKPPSSADKVLNPLAYDASFLENSNVSIGDNLFTKGRFGRPDLSSYYLRIYKKESILLFLDYMNKFRSNSIKHTRLDLINELYILNEKKAGISLF